MKKNRLSMNLIMALAMAAVAVCVLVCAIVIFVQTYRSALLRNAETTSRQAIAQVSSTMEEYLEDMNDSVALLTEYLDLPVRQREARFETFLEIKPDVVAITTYDADGQMKKEMEDDTLLNILFDYNRDNYCFLVFFQKKGIGKIPLTREFYRQVEDKYKDAIKEHSMDSFMKVDMEWAGKILFKNHNKFN